MLTVIAFARVAENEMLAREALEMMRSQAGDVQPSWTPMGGRASTD
ncbi:MAG TPA: hypothetical protein VJV97_07780 [Gemmatimonadaceae bacterium]|nr:hypothetical protein [Gemmatimonadaceae bacterium]